MNYEQDSRHVSEFSTYETTRSCCWTAAKARANALLSEKSIAVPVSEKANRPVLATLASDVQIKGVAMDPPAFVAAEFDSELEVVRAKLVFVATLAIPLLLIATLPSLFGLHLDRATASLLRFSEFLLATPLVWVTLSAFAVRGWKGLRQASPIKMMLIGLGVLIAYTFGLGTFLAPAPSPVPFYFAAAGVMVVLAQLDHWLRLRSVNQAKGLL